MSRKIRFAAALLILASLTCGSLVALPFGPRVIPAETARGDFLTAVVEWISSLFAKQPSVGRVPAPPQAKDGAHIDPSGGPH